MPAVIDTERLVLRPWTERDAPEALTIFRHDRAAISAHAGRTPNADVHTMLSLMHGWHAEERNRPPAGHWAVELLADRRVIGGCSLSFAPPGPDSLKFRCVLRPEERGRGYAAEAGDALVRWALHEGGVPEVFAVAQNDNLPAQTTALRMGMLWVGESDDKGTSLQVFRMRHGDLPWDDSAHEEPPLASPGLWNEADLR